MKMTPAQVVKNMFSGAVVGVANVIPGVSGGTMAVVLHVFDQMMETLGLKKFRKNLGFLITFGLGAVLGIAAFSSAIKWLLQSYPVATSFAFIGLILGSVPMIFRRATRGSKKVTVGNAAAFLTGLGVMLVLAFVNESAFSTSAAEVLTFPLAVQLFLVGMLASVAMILPGISGSLIMVIFGTYYTVIGSISGIFSGLMAWLSGTGSFAALMQNVWLLLPALAGILLGLVFGSRLIDFVIKKYPQMAYSAILGLILGSFAALIPHTFLFNAEGIAAILLLIAGAAVSYLFSRNAAD
ncbi:MAG: DUF368 domain-containing protein [Firmicutes bacterium]|nr:DUF368 domain-containing protein [Bacillota bacterium]